MTRFAKYVSEDYVKFAPKHIKTSNLIAFNFNQNEELCRSMQYYPIVELNTVEEVTDETHWAKPQYALIEAEEDGKDVSYITVTYTKEAITDEGNE